MSLLLSEATEQARSFARQRGFRLAGIYHLLYICHQGEGDIFNRWLQRYGIERDSFVKAMETVVRHRRAGGGLPRDRQDAEAFEQVLALAAGEPAVLDDLDDVWERLPENPLLALCERFLVPVNPY